MGNATIDNEARKAILEAATKIVIERTRKNRKLEDVLKEHQTASSALEKIWLNID